MSNLTHSTVKHPVLITQLWLGLLQQHDVRIRVAAKHAQLAAVERPVKVLDPFRLEVRDLLSRRTVERLQPEVCPILVSQSIDHSVAIMGEADRPIRLRRALKFYKSRILGRIYRHRRQLFSGGGASRAKGCQLAVGRNVELAIPRALGKPFALPPSKSTLVSFAALFQSV